MIRPRIAAQIEPRAMTQDHNAASSAQATGTPASTLVPPPEAVQRWTDVYFKRTRQIVERFGDVPVTYAIFMRRPVVFAPRLALDWLRGICAARGFEPVIEQNYAEGKWVGAGEPMLWITGPFSGMAELETIFLMKLGPACVAAYNAYSMAAELPNVAFIAMDARHCAGTEMAEIMAYASSVGSARARRKVGAKGFIGNATDATAHMFGMQVGMGTMPHALIGYAGSTVRAAEMYRETFPDEPMTVLVDYFGQEVSDALEVCRRFPELAASGQLSVRLDTPGGRFVEGLDPPQSYAVLDRRAPESIRGYRNETELRYLIGAGVSAAAVHWVREKLDDAGFDKVRIVGSSGFSPEKCRIMADANAPLDVVGTGSYLPEKWGETYATADIVAYDGVPRVKVGREFLLKR
ncbi:beta/alpha barrel domain-containing protein [Indioceanicola profundi]|nr:nicotinate phosphoribosyltransferase [Indioceanicola profundi]